MTEEAVVDVSRVRELKSNCEFLELLGLVENSEGHLKVSKAVVLKDENTPGFKNYPMTFTLDKILRGSYSTANELDEALKETPYLEDLRIFIPHFRPQENGLITQKAQYWDKFKAWRFDIDKEYSIKDITNYCLKLPLLPNIVRKSKRGWHLIYLFDKYITREAYELYLSQSSNRQDENVYLQFMIYQLLTKHIPVYLRDKVKIPIDIGASSNISMIATRLITTDLPATYLREPYSLSEFYKAFKDAILETFDIENDKDSNPPPNKLQLSDIPKETVYSLISKCHVLQALEKDWERHGYYEWLTITNYYAIKFLAEKTEEGKNKIKQEFHEKSSRHPKYDYREAEYHFNYAVKRQSEGLKPPGCRWIGSNINPEYTKACESCQYKRLDKDGNIIGHFFFDGLKKESLEDLSIEGWELRKDGWCCYVKKLGYVRVLPYFKIEAHYTIEKREEEFIRIVDNRGRSYIKKVERRKDTYIPTVDFVKSFGYINPDRVKEGRRFLAHYIEKVKEVRGIKIDFLGYKYHNGFWDIAVGGDGKFSRNEISFIFYGKEIEELDWYIPSVRGSEDKFKELYLKAFKLDDPALHLAIAHFLSWIGKQFINDRSLKPNLNPILIFLGDTGTGKSIRVKIATALYGNPNLFSFTNITQASFNNNFPLIKTPFGIDEVITKSEKDEAKFGELIYNITNIQGKMTYNTTYNPINTPLIITGETENLLIDKMFKAYRGLNRRTVIIEMTTDWKHNSDTLDYIIDKLQAHHGHILSYVKSLNEIDRLEIEETSGDIYTRLHFLDNSFKDLKKHIALSMAMFKHFFYRFIGADKKEIEEKIIRTIDFVANQMNQNQLNRIGENIDYVEETMDFISRVIEAWSNRIELKGLSYKQVCSRLRYTPSNKVGELLKKFFFKTYPSTGKSNGKVVFHVSTLLNYPTVNGKIDNTSPEFIADKTRIYEFTKEELMIWLEVLRLRYGDKKYDEIKEALEINKLLSSDPLSCEDKEDDVVDF
ncbi:MAG: DUF927 domain-containing protein [Sulfurihydrogenibium sp.]|jgi:hypothetical protein|nr:DUF927 domain-containing protein [Sulfurihydrogenibium sp.]